jgi:hypothetical protein
MGLIQFMPSTARRLGTTTSELEKMPATEQMKYVYQYLEPFKGRLSSYDDVAMAIFYPAAVEKPDSFSIAAHFYDMKLRQFSKRNDPARAERLAQQATDKMVRQNGGIRTRGDYLQRLGPKSGTTANLRKVDPEYVEFSAFDPLSLPLRKDAVKLREDRYYMFPGLYSLLFQYVGLNEVNRELLGELPVARTPFEKAAIGDQFIDPTLPGTDVQFSDVMGGPIALPTTRAGLMLWAKTTLGVRTSEVNRSQTALSEEPRRPTTTTTPEGTRVRK